MMFVEKLAMDMLKEKYPGYDVKFNGSDSPDFTITRNPEHPEFLSGPDGYKKYVEVKSIHRKDGGLHLKCRQIHKIKRLPNVWLWVFDCHDKLICKAPMESIIPLVTKQIKSLKIVWHNPSMKRRKV